MTKALDIPRPSRLPKKLQAKLERAMLGWLDKLGPHTRRSYRRGLVHFAEWLAGEEALVLPDAPPLRSDQRGVWEDQVVSAAGKYLLGLKPADANFLVEAYLEELLYPTSKSQEPYTRSTVNSRLCALKWAVKSARRMGQVTWDLEAELPPVKKDRSGRLREKAGRDMQGPTKAEAERLIGASILDDDPRSWFLLCVLRYEGYREHEIRQINIEDVDLRKREVMLVRKKRDKPKPYPLSKNTVEALQAWLKIRGRDKGPLLYGGKKGRNPDKRIGETTIYFIVQRVSAAAKVADMSPHKIRHRACTDIVQSAIKQGLPEEEMLYLTGHSSRAALQPYYEASKSRKSARQVLDAIDDLVDEDDDD